eukprot:1015711-Amphidinium_carterae.5
MAKSITTIVIVQLKGADPYAIAEVKKFILENGFITSVLQSDGEPAIKSLQEKVIEGCSGFRCQSSMECQSTTSTGIIQHSFGWSCTVPSLTVRGSWIQFIGKQLYKSSQPVIETNMMESFFKSFYSIYQLEPRERESSQCMWSQRISNSSYTQSRTSVAR